MHSTLKFFDFNVHPCIHNISTPLPTQKLISSEFNFTSDILEVSYTSLVSSANNSLIGFNYMIFSDVYCHNPSSASNLFDLSQYYHEKNSFTTFFTQLIDPRLDLDFYDLFITLKSFNFKFIKFHPYHQKIDKHLHARCIYIAKVAEKCGLGICIDASYGTKYLYDYDNLYLAALVSQNVSSTPIVILHAGGYRAIEAALIASDCPNVFIEISFSPVYYKNTSIYTTFVDMFTILQPSKFLHASDFPYISFQESIQATNDLVRHADLPVEALTSISSGNAFSLLSSYFQ